MPGLWWFTGLAVIGAVLAIFTIYKKRRLCGLSAWLVFYLFATGITWVGEFIVLGLFGSYAYKPGVFADPWAENLLGHMILNSTLWPGTAVLVAGFRLGYGWIALISGGYVLVEWLFLKLAIYEQHWWRYYMTAGTVVLFLVIARYWFTLMNEKRHGWPRFATLFFAMLVVIHLPNPLLLLAGKQYYNAGLAANLVLSSTLFSFCYHSAEAFLAVTFFTLGRYWKLVPFVTAVAGQTFLAARHILVFRGGWNLYCLLLVYLLGLGICLLLEKYVLRPPAIFRRFR